jgi:hypothetical protein
VIPSRCLVRSSSSIPTVTTATCNQAVQGQSAHEHAGGENGLRELIKHNKPAISTGRTTAGKRAGNAGERTGPSAEAGGTPMGTSSASGLYQVRALNRKRPAIRWGALPSVSYLPAPTFVALDLLVGLDEPEPLIYAPGYLGQDVRAVRITQLVQLVDSFPAALPEAGQRRR